MISAHEKLKLTRIGSTVPDSVFISIAWTIPEVEVWIFINCDAQLVFTARLTIQGNVRGDHSASHVDVEWCQSFLVRDVSTWNNFI